MSKINGEKARASIAKKRRTAQRELDRAGRARLAEAAKSQPEAAAAKSEEK